MKAKSFEIYPIYLCNSCGSEHTEEIEYVNKIGKILCGCGNILNLDKIKNIDISPRYKTTKKKKIINIKEQKKEVKNNAEENSKQQYMVRGVELLVSIGMLKSNAKNMCVDALKEWKDSYVRETDDCDDFLRYLLTKIPSPVQGLS
jgi:hypothetical protein